MSTKIKRRQILNYRFEDLDDGRTKVRLPNGTINIIWTYLAENEYNKLYAIKYCDKICDQVIKELGYTKSKIKLADSSVINKFKLRMLQILTEKQINLIYNKVKTNKYSLILQGNREDIVNSYIEYLWKKEE